VSGRRFARAVHYESRMRWLLALAAAAVLALPASAAGVDPRLFVLRQIDVPPRYDFDEDNSLLIPSGARLAGVPDESAKALVRLGFVGGYIARYTNYGPPRWRYVNSVAFVFREAKGARSYLPLMVKSGFAQGGGRARRVNLGDEALLYSSSSRSTGTAIIWRHGRVVAYVSCSQMTEHRALALAQARKQQRRIAAELR
jgi:hypothetical protein